MSKLIYLAIPYSGLSELSFAIANEVTAELIMKGKVVFSPISMSHLISDYLPKEQRNSSEFWLNADLPILRRCDELLVVKIGNKGQELIDKSVGCQAEIQCAKENNIPVNYYEYEM